MRPAPADVSFALSVKLPHRTIITNDFQLSILRRGLEALDREARRRPRRFGLTPAQRYELHILAGMIDDALREPDPAVVQGFVL